MYLEFSALMFDLNYLEGVTDIRLRIWRVERTSFWPYLSEICLIGIIHGDSHLLTPFPCL